MLEGADGKMVNMDPTTEPVKNVPNPTGKGGFKDNPQNANPGGRPKNQQSFTYWMNFFKNLPVSEFLQYQKTHPVEGRTVAEDIAFTRVVNARTDLQEFKEVADRTEGKAKQLTELRGDVNISFKNLEDVIDQVLTEPEEEEDDESNEQTEEDPTLS